MHPSYSVIVILDSKLTLTKLIVVAAQQPVDVRIPYDKMIIFI